MQKSVMTCCMIVIRWGSMTVTGERKFENQLGPQVGFELATHYLTAERAPGRINCQTEGPTPVKLRVFCCSTTDRRGFVVWLLLPVSSSENLLFCTGK